MLSARYFSARLAQQPGDFFHRPACYYRGILVAQVQDFDQDQRMSFRLKQRRHAGCALDSINVSLAAFFPRQRWMILFRINNLQSPEFAKKWG